LERRPPLQSGFSGENTRTEWGALDGHQTGFNAMAVVAPARAPPFNLFGSCIYAILASKVDDGTAE
jgi:hypothetical protein